MGPQVGWKSGMECSKQISKTLKRLATGHLDGSTVMGFCQWIHSGYTDVIKWSLGSECGN